MDWDEKSRILKQLREKIQATQPAPTRILAHKNFAPGIPQGVLTQVTGSLKTQFVVDFLKEQNRLQILWIESDFCIYPYALWQQEVELGNVFFVKTKKYADQICKEVMDSQVFDIVVLSELTISSSLLIRLHNSIHKSFQVVFLLSSKAISHYTIKLSLFVDHEGVKTLSCKGLGL
jgi:hypothetical protein